MNKLKLLFLPFAAVLLILSACGSDEPQVESGSVTEEESSENEEIVQEEETTEESSGDELFKDKTSGHEQVDGCEMGSDGDEVLKCSVELPEEYQNHNEDTRYSDGEIDEVNHMLLGDLEMIPNSAGPSSRYIEEVSNNTFQAYVTYEVGVSDIGSSHHDTYKSILETASTDYTGKIPFVVRAYNENFTDNANVKTVSFLSKVPDESGPSEIGVYSENEAHTWVVFQFNLEECAQNNCTAESTEEIYKYTDFIDTSDFMYEQIDIENFDVDPSLFKGSF